MTQKIRKPHSRSFIMGSMYMLSMFIIIMGVSLCFVQTRYQNADESLEITSFEYPPLDVTYMSKTNPITESQ